MTATERTAMETEQLVFNGIDGTHGGYLLQGLTPQRIAAVARGLPLEAAHLNDLKGRHSRDTEATFGTIEGIDPKDLAQTGWGVIFSFNADPAIRDALSPLLELRQAQATRVNDRYYQEYKGSIGYRPGDTKNQWLSRNGSAPGPANPAKIPYYLLIVGDPETIPYKFQYQLDVQYAVGRLHFETLDEYAHYARSVVLAESGALALPRRAVFFGTHNPFDAPTQQSAFQLVKPLADTLRQDQPSWNLGCLLEAEATKARLGSLLGGDETPAVLFTASHGMAFAKDDPRQSARQGALLCQDWPGPIACPLPSEDHYFAADDLSGDARLLGLLSFHFACYGAGTPHLDDFARQANKDQGEEIAPSAFVARLPQRLLSHPKGGALAVIGHVERAWGCSFLWDQKRQVDVYDSTLKRLFEGHPVGSALEFFNARYAELASDLSAMLEEIEANNAEALADVNTLTSLWTANNDARNFMVIGDPAVRLMVRGADAADPGAWPRPTLEIITKPAAPLVVDTVTPAPAAMAADVVAFAPTAAADGPAVAPDSAPASFIRFGSAPKTDDGALPASSARTGLGQALEQFAGKLGDVLTRAMDEAATLEVKTYVSDSMEGVGYDMATGQLSGAVKLRALTRMNLVGDTIVCVPEQDGKVDDALWAIHRDTVDRAQAYRAELLKSAIAAASGLVSTLKTL